MPLELLQDSDSSSEAIGPHWPSSYPEYLSPDWDKDKQRRVVWNRLQSQRSNLASQLSEQKECYLTLCQELNPRTTQVESSHEPLFRDKWGTAFGMLYRAYCLCPVSCTIFQSFQTFNISLSPGYQIICCIRQWTLWSDHNGTARGAHRQTHTLGSLQALRGGLGASSWCIKYPSSKPHISPLLSWINSHPFLRTPITFSITSWLKRDPLCTICSLQLKNFKLPGKQNATIPSMKCTTTQSTMD